MEKRPIAEGPGPTVSRDAREDETTFEEVVLIEEDEHVEGPPDWERKDLQKLLVYEHTASVVRRRIRNIIGKVPAHSRAFYIYLERIFENTVSDDAVEVDLKAIIAKLLADLIQRLPRQRLCRVVLLTKNHGASIERFASSETVMARLHEANDDLTRCSTAQLPYNEQDCNEGLALVASLRWSINADPNFLASLIRFLRSHLVVAEDPQMSPREAWSTHWAILFLWEILKMADEDPTLKTILVELNNRNGEAVEEKIGRVQKDIL